MEKELIQIADSLYDRIAELIEQSRHYVKTTVNTAMVYTYYNVGRYIVEGEQHGKERAAYGESVLKELSAKLTANFGAGWSVDNLEKARLLFLTYPKSATLSRKSILPEKSATPSRISSDDKLDIVEPEKPFLLSWSHYLILMRIKNPEERSFGQSDLAQRCQHLCFRIRAISSRQSLVASKGEGMD